MESTDIERRLDGLMQRYGSPDDPRFALIFSRLKLAVDEAEANGLHPEQICYAVAQHAAALMAAQKIASTIRPELAQALVDDFKETVLHRAVPGVPFLVQPPWSKR